MALPSVGETVFMVVAQQPFESEKGGVVPPLLQACGPLFREDLTRADRKDFPENGQVWWMLTGSAHLFAEPGRLVAGAHRKCSRSRPRSIDVSS